jgi:hypothetical protein
LTTPLFHLSLPDTDDASHFAPLQIALEGLTAINEWHIRRALRRLQKGKTNRMEIPPLYQSGVYYKEEAPGHEDWMDAPAVLRQGFADCEDLAAYRCAELRVFGYVDCEPVIKWQKIPKAMMVQNGYPAKSVPAGGVWLVHCCVRWPEIVDPQSGVVLRPEYVEDPSKKLGMGGSYTSRI